ncbi:hypothetical protein [Dyadobacter fermentans]|uniref:hypothetical protein n=1 Tax=Dyadobacter fermentans TaxID=94254 RepID=UPI001CBCE183|nr:hypothetical protein [Dyadobacter fermentans]MBZ1362141.1 hypothetical protein [Dyadobacter fermentans]
MKISNRVNESKTGDELVYDNFPAYRKEPGSVEEDNEKRNASRSVTSVDWEIHFIPGLDIETGWKIKDIFSGKLYNVVADATEIERRKRILIKTELAK